VASLATDGGAALRAIAISASRSIRYGSIEAMVVDGADLSCACIRHGVEKPNINAKLKEANTTNFRLRIIFSFGWCFPFFCPSTRLLVEEKWLAYKPVCMQEMMLSPDEEEQLVFYDCTAEIPTKLVSLKRSVERAGEISVKRLIAEKVISLSVESVSSRLGNDVD
jgi:hypothetical protein